MEQLYTFATTELTIRPRTLVCRLARGGKRSTDPERERGGRLDSPEARWRRWDSAWQMLLAANAGPSADRLDDVKIAMVRYLRAERAVLDGLDPPDSALESRHTRLTGAFHNLLWERPGSPEVRPLLTRLTEIFSQCEPSPPRPESEVVPV